MRSLKGIVFYSVPHSGASKDFEKYFTDANNVPFLKSSDRSQGLTRCISDFNREMAQLTIDFLGSIEDDMNLYAILEGKAMGSKVQNFLINLNQTGHLATGILMCSSSYSYFVLWYKWFKFLIGEWKKLDCSCVVGFGTNSNRSPADTQWVHQGWRC